MDAELKITKATKNRASLALLMLAGCFGDGFGAEECRKYDDCFEAGDGTQVVCEIMRQALTNKNIMAILQRPPACRYVDIAGWTKTYNNLKGD